MKERSTVVHVGGIATMHGVKYQHLKKKFSSTRRSNSPTNFNPAPATFTPKRHCSTLLKASHASTASTAKLAGVSVSHAAAASSSRPSSLQHPQFPALPSNRRPPLATLPDPKPKQTHSVVPCAGIPHGAVGSAPSFAGRKMLYTAHQLMVWFAEPNAGIQSFASSALATS